MATATSTATATVTCDNKTDDKTTHSQRQLYKAKNKKKITKSIPTWRSRKIWHMPPCIIVISPGPWSIDYYGLQTAAWSDPRQPSIGISLHFEGVNAHARPSCQHINFICISARRWFRITSVWLAGKTSARFSRIAHFWRRLVPWPTLWTGGTAKGFLVVFNLINLILMSFSYTI